MREGNIEQFHSRLGRRLLLLAGLQSISNHRCPTRKRLAAGHDQCAALGARHHGRIGLLVREPRTAKQQSQRRTNNSTTQDKTSTRQFHATNGTVSAGTMSRTFLTGLCATHLTADQDSARGFRPPIGSYNVSGRCERLLKGPLPKMASRHDCHCGWPPSGCSQEWQPQMNGKHLRQATHPGEWTTPQHHWAPRCHHSSLAGAVVAEFQLLASCCLNAG